MPMWHIPVSLIRLNIQIQMIRVPPTEISITDKYIAWNRQLLDYRAFKVSPVDEDPREFGDLTFLEAEEEHANVIWMSQGMVGNFGAYQYDDMREKKRKLRIFEPETNRNVLELSYGEKDHVQSAASSESFLAIYLGHSSSLFVFSVESKKLTKIQIDSGNVFIKIFHDRILSVCHKDERSERVTKICLINLKRGVEISWIMK